MKHNLATIKFALIACFTLIAIQTQAAPKTKDYVGVTTQDVTLYSSASTNAYEVGELPKGSIVFVLDIVRGHYRAQAPQGVYSYIRKSDVKLNSSGDKAQVTAKRTQVRVAHTKGYRASIKTHKTLHQGSYVTLVKNDTKNRKHGEYYLITPPQGAPIYIRPSMIRHATPTEIKLGRADDAPEKIIIETPIQKIIKPKTQATDKEEKDKTTTKEADKPKTQIKQDPKTNQGTASKEDTKTETAKTKDKSADAQKDTAKDKEEDKKLPKAVSLKIRALEDEFHAAQELPILSRPHANLIEEYTAASKDRKNKLGRIDSYIVKFRLRILKHEQARASMIRRINASLSKVQDTAEVEQLLANVEQSGKIRYNFTGIIMPSSVYNGKKLPRYYRLVDPASNRTLAYIQPSAAFVPKRHLGIWVGIIGKKQSVRGIAGKVILPKTIDVLQAESKK